MHFEMLYKTQAQLQTYLGYVMPLYQLGESGGPTEYLPRGPNFSHFHGVFGENSPNNRLASTLGVGASRLGNPGF